MPVVTIAMILSLVILAMTLTAAHGLLPLNGAVGIRTGATMRDEDTWRRAHQAALPVTALTAGVVVPAGVTSIASGWLDGHLELAGSVLLAATVAGLLVAAVVAHRAARA